MIDAAKSLKFKNGKLVKAALPTWYRKALAEEDDFKALLTKAGASNVDEYGDGADSIQMFRGPNNGYLIIFHDTFEMICLVFIDNVADFLTFKAQTSRPSPSSSWLLTSISSGRRNAKKAVLAVDGIPKSPNGLSIRSLSAGEVL